MEFLIQGKFFPINEIKKDRNQNDNGPLKNLLIISFTLPDKQRLDVWPCRR